MSKSPAPFSYIEWKEIKNTPTKFKSDTMLTKSAAFNPDVMKQHSHALETQQLYAARVRNYNQEHQDNPVFTPYNGELITFAAKQNRISVFPTDYLSTALVQHFPYFNLAALTLIVTHDNMVIAGSRDVAGIPSPEEAHKDLPAQYPAGMIERFERDGDSTLHQTTSDLFKSKSYLKDWKELFIQTAAKEASEEAYGDLQLKNLKILGIITGTKTWQRKQQKNPKQKDIRSFKTVLVYAETPLTSLEIQQNRAPNNTKDLLTEMRELYFIPLSEFNQMTAESTVQLRSNQHPVKFVQEQSYIPEFLQDPNSRWQSLIKARQTQQVQAL